MSGRRHGPWEASQIRVSQNSERSAQLQLVTCRNSGPLGPYIRAARWIPAGIDPFIDPRVMLFEGMTAEFRRPQEELL